MQQVAPTIVLPLLLAACGSAQSTAEASTESLSTDIASQPDPEAMVELVPLASLAEQHISGIAPGTDGAVVIELLGEPESIEADGVIMEATGTSFETWSYAAQGLSITLERLTDDDASVAWIAAAAPWAGAMPCGLQIGMTEADAMMVLGDEGRLVDEEEWASLTAISEEGRVQGLVLSQMGE